MENSWQRKLGSFWRQPNPPPPPPLSASSLLDSHAQLLNADCHLYMQLLQESTPLTGGVTQEHILSNMHGFDNLGNAQLGTSFLSLISGSTAHMPCDQQHLLDPNTSPVSNLLSPSCRTPHGVSGGSRSRIPVLPGVPWLNSMDCPNLTSGEIFPPFTLSNANANCINNSAMFQAASLDVQKSQTIACQNSHEKDKKTMLLLAVAGIILPTVSSVLLVLA